MNATLADEAIKINNTDFIANDKNYVTLTYKGSSIKIPETIAKNIDILFKNNSVKVATSSILLKYIRENNLDDKLNDNAINNSIDEESTLKDSKLNVLFEKQLVYSPVELFKIKYLKGAFEMDYELNMNELSINSAIEYYSKINENIQELKSSILSNTINLHINYLANKSSQISQTNNLNEEEGNFNNNQNSIIKNISTATEKEYYKAISKVSNKLDNKRQNSIEDDEYSGYSTLSSSDETNINTTDKDNREGGFEVPLSLNQISSTYVRSNLADVSLNLNRYEREKNKKFLKNQITIETRSDLEKDFFKLQEIERYKYPHLPWIYYNLDGSKTSIVCPILKKCPPFPASSKPRDHEMLKKDRPGFITILCLARDAASRLKNGVGTRADICDLIKDSFYINNNVNDLQINTIVSGALDRLHYENDPCVKYDTQQKLWIYLHGNRTLSYSSKKIIVIFYFLNKLFNL